MDVLDLLAGYKLSHVTPNPYRNLSGMFLFLGDFTANTIVHGRPENVLSRW